MDIILWLVFGGIAGWIASMIMGSQQGLLMDVVLGIIGALIGGFIMTLIGQSSTMGFNIYSLLVAVLGSVILIWLGRMFQKTTP